MKTFDGKEIEVGKTYYTSNCFEDNRIELTEHCVAGTINEGKYAQFIIDKDGNKKGIWGLCSTKEAAYTELYERLERIDVLKEKENSKEVKKLNKKLNRIKDDIKLSNEFLSDWKSNFGNVKLQLDVLLKK